MTKTTIQGVITAVSNPKVFKVEKATKADYFHMTMKDDSGRTILVYISTVALGLYSESQSKVFFFDKKRKTLVKHRMVTPARLVNHRVKIDGDLTLRPDGYYMSYIRSLVLL